MFQSRIIASLSVWLLLATTACTMWGEKKSVGWKQATSGEHIERLFWKNVKEKDWKSINSRLAPLMVSMDGNSRFDKAATLEQLKGIDLTDFQIGDLQTETAGVDLIVTYTLAGRGTIGGKPFPQAPFRMMSVWQQIGKGWIMVAHTSVPTN